MSREVSRMAGRAAERAPQVRTSTEVRVHEEGAEALRGQLFTDLDRLAFALEVEAAEALDAGDEAEALRIEDRRLGVRLAQRLVAGVHADEVDQRIERVRRAYEQRVRGG